MSDQVAKSAKRLAARPASYSIAAKSTSKGSKLAAKSARPKHAAKRLKGASKPPVRKATPAKSPAKPAAKKTPESKSGKASRPAAKSVKKAAARSSRPAAKSRPATPVKPTKKTSPPPAKAQTRRHAPAPLSKGRATRPSKPSAAAAKPGAKPASRPAPAPPRQPTRDEAAALKAFERAHKEFTRGRFAEARMLFRALIEQHAGVAEVTARARTYLAIAEARLRSESSLPRDAESLYDRGVIELNRGDYVAAQEMFERALKREPDAPDIHYALAATRARLGAVEPALQSLERALELKPSLRVRVQHDADLTLLRSEPEYERLLYPASHP